MSTDLQETYLLARSGRYANPRRTGDVLPIVYGDLTTGGDTTSGVWTCPCIDTVNFKYAVASHPVLSLAQGNSVTVFDRDKAVISPTQYTFSESENVEGQGEIATLTFTSDRKASEPITIRSKGKDDGAGKLLTNPIDIACDFLETFVGVDGSEIDTTWKTRTANHLAEFGGGVAAAGVIDRDVRPDRFLSELLRLLASWWRSGGGAIIFKPHIGPGRVRESDVAARLTAKHFDEQTLRACLDEGSICTRAPIEYSYNNAEREYEDQDDGSTTAALDQEARYGRQYSRSFRLPWIRSATTVRSIQETVVDFYGRPPLMISGDLTGYEHLYLEPGDVISISLDALYDENLLPLRNQLCRLVTVRPDLDRGRVFIEALDLDVYLTITYPADGGHTAAGVVMAGADRDRRLAV